MLDQWVCKICVLYGLRLPEGTRWGYLYEGVGAQRLALAPQLGKGIGSVSKMFWGVLCLWCGALASAGCLIYLHRLVCWAELQTFESGEFLGNMLMTL